MIVYLQRLSDKDILIVLCFIVTLKVVPKFLAFLLIALVTSASQQPKQETQLSLTNHATRLEVSQGNQT